MTKGRWIALAITVVLAVAAVLVVVIVRPFSNDEAPERTAIAPEPRNEPSPVAPRTDVHVDATRAASLGVRTVLVTSQPMATELRAVLTIVPDEARVSHVHTRVSGWIQELFVRTTGERVRRGQPLATIFSQELLASQNEYLAALRASPGAPSPIARGARSRLLVFGMTEGAIRALERRGQAARNVTIVAPRAGVVFHRGISAGTSVDPSTELFTVLDLSRVWALAEVPEADAAAIAVGTRTRIDVPGSGRAPTDARVAFVYPTLSEQTRTARVRLPLANDDGALRPGMFGTATFALAAREALTVPRDAIVDTGIRQHVFVAERPDHFVPRTVRLGMQSEDRVEVREGLRAGERVVSEGVFLIDSESRLRASGGGMGHAHGAQPSRSGEQEEHPPTSRAESPHAGHGGM